MDEIIKKIEDVVELIIAYDGESYAVAAQELVGDMIAVFPEIVRLYTNPGMSEYIEDAKYWPKQLERIINALSSGDDLATLDILYNETRANLIELKGILKEKGIA